MLFNSLYNLLNREGVMLNIDLNWSSLTSILLYTLNFSISNKDSLDFNEAQVQPVMIAYSFF